MVRDTAKSVLLGLAFDARDGHKRITKGKNFYILGGSKDTHKALAETAVEFNVELDRRHKDLNNISREEFYDIANKLGLRRPSEK